MKLSAAVLELSSKDKSTLYAAYQTLATDAGVKAKASSSFNSKGQVYEAIVAIFDKAHTIINALMAKTVENGATEGEERAAYAKAKEMILKYAKLGLSSDAYVLPPAVAARLTPVKPAEKPEAPQKPAQGKPEAKPRSGRIIRVASEELLLKVVGKGKDGKDVGLSYEEILAAVREEFPDAKTSLACLRWYAVQMRERGERLPNRPRASSKKAA